MTCRQASLLIGLVAALTGRGALAAPPRVLTVDQIKSGQRGYGLTVFQGFKVERFDVEVIDVLTNFLPKQDIIIMRGDHPELRRAGVLGGMSGSPIFIDGKLVGALAYGWRFAKEPIFGVTPIGNMLTLLQRKRRGPAEAGAGPVSTAGPPVQPRAASGISAAIVSRERRIRQRLAALAMSSLAMRDRWWRLPFPTRPPPASSTLTQLTVPLNVAGVSSRALPDLRRAFASFGFEPVRGGGSGRVEGPRRFSQGSAIGVHMVRGDISMSGTGTVTWTNDHQALAFGHSMFNAGEIYLPVVTAKINYSLASLSRSFKLSSPARLMGSLVQDRQPGIMADMRERVSMIPMTVTMRSYAGTFVYHVELARHRVLTPTLAASVLGSAINEATADVARATFDMITRFTVKGYPEIRIVEQKHSPGGLRMAALFASRGLGAINLVMNNPYEPAELERVDVDIRVSYEDPPVSIIAVRLRSNIVKPGATVPVDVTYRPLDGTEFTKTYQLAIPRTLAGSVVEVEVSGGSAVQPEVAVPENLSQMLAQLPEGYPGRSVVISLKIPSEGLKLRGRVIRDLPVSVADSLQLASQVRQESSFKMALRRVFGTKRLVIGRKELRLRVEEEEAR